MNTRQIFSVAACSSIVQSVGTGSQEMALSSLIDRSILQFAQIDQQKGKRHECGYAHDMLKDPANQMSLADWNGRKFTDTVFPY